MSGSHGIAHTRMATEFAVTTDGAHPFSTGRDQCLVHNGSLSNHNALRRQLKRHGLSFETDNDTEVAAGYLTWRMSQGDSLGDALKHSLDDLDGFYTFVVGTEDGFGVLRDPIACKPAVMAETDDYVAFGSEYRALAAFPASRRRMCGSRRRPRSISGNGIDADHRSRGRRHFASSIRCCTISRRGPTTPISACSIRAAAMPSPPASMHPSPSRSTAMSAITAPA